MSPKQIDAFARLSLTFLVAIGFFGVIAGVIISVRDQTDHDILSMMAGTLGTVFANIVYSYFKKDGKGDSK